VISKDEDGSQEGKAATRETSDLYTVKERAGPVGLIPKPCHHGNDTARHSGEQLMWPAPLGRTVYFRASSRQPDNDVWHGEPSGSGLDRGPD
jgi:hypothetical protein